MSIKRKHEELLKEKGGWLESEEYQKAISQFRMVINGIENDVFPEDAPSIFRFEYMEALPYRVDNIVKAAEDFGLRIRGIKDKPISYDYIKRRGK